jgi:NitT/TauT family transport system ATP-binding protein
MSADTANRTARFARPAPEGEHVHSTGDDYIALHSVSKRYQTRDRSTLALTGIDLAIAKQEFVALVGQSGCGKTTMLRIMAGLTTPTEGEVTIAGQPLWRGERRDDDALRKLGLVFQDANLFPWYSVEENFSLPLLLRKVDKRARLKRAHALAELVGLTGFERALPRELSGGMKQRVAIARALSYHPEILLLDEPTGGMSREESAYTVALIRTVTEGKTLLVVEHDMNVVFTLCDQISVLVYGEVIASGEPETVRGNRAVQEAYLGEEVA